MSNAKIILGVMIAIAMCITSMQGQQLLKERPDFLEPCHFHKPDEQCYRKSFEAAFTHWRHGIPGLKDLSPIDPFHLKKIRITHRTENVADLQVELKKVLVTGLSNVKFTKVHVDDKEFIMKFNIRIPVAKMTSDYKMKGTILLLNIDSHGTLEGEVSNLDATVIAKTSLKKQGDEYIFDVISVDSHIDSIGGFRIHMSNLFNGNRDLEDSANQLFNESWQQLFEVMRPTFGQTLDRVVYDRYKTIFSTVPARFFFHDVP